MKKDYDIHYPSYIKRLGTWPLNFGLFFLYNTIVNIVLSILAAIIFTSRGVTDTAVVVQKTQGLAVIGIILTLGITLIFQRRFYVHKVEKHEDHAHEEVPNVSEEVKADEEVKSE